MTLQNFGQPLLLVAASACKCGGCMTLQKSAFRWLHEAANWQQVHALLKQLRAEVATIPELPEEERSQAITAVDTIEKSLTTAPLDVERAQKWLKLYATLVAVSSPTLHALQAICSAL
jgi:hypothetical protein